MFEDDDLRGHEEERHQTPAEVTTLPRMSLNERIVLEILRWIGKRQEFELSELRASVELALGPVADGRFGVMLTRAKDRLREDGIDYRPDNVGGRTGILLRSDDVHSARRTIKYGRNGRRKCRRANAIADCVANPEKLPPVLKQSLEGEIERNALVEAAARRRTRRRLPGL
jgi:hypothetical protein